MPTETYGSPVDLEGEVWPAGGRLQTELYGDRVNNMVNCKVNGDYTVVQTESHQAYDFGGFFLSEGDCLNIYADITEDPDYRIVSITPYNPLYLEAERIV